ncbi:MAG: asparaginase domain-containing protein [Thermodesulfobacteriota bacterium]
MPAAPLAPIRILAAGGTLDKEYDKLRGELVFTRSHLAEILDQARVRTPFTIETVMLKDSLHMDQADREAILARCLASPEERIIVTHGTDTLAETARLLGQRLSGKTVVLVGAMIPFSFGGSDAMFNLGCAMAAVQLCPPGVWVTMNGRFFPWDDVRKDKAAGDFVPLASDPS